MGPTEGVRFVKELLAGMTNSAALDTLDGNSDTSPLSKKLCTDLSQDNDKTGGFSDLVLYSDIAYLSNTTIIESDKNAAAGCSAA